MRNNPVSPVTAVLRSPVSWLVAAISTPGMAAPEASRTYPSRRVPVTWPKAVPVQMISSSRAAVGCPSYSAVGDAVGVLKLLLSAGMCTSVPEKLLDIAVPHFRRGQRLLNTAVPVRQDSRRVPWRFTPTGLSTSSK